MPDDEIKAAIQNLQQALKNTEDEENFIRYIEDVKALMLFVVDLKSLKKE